MRYAVALAAVVLVAAVGQAEACEVRLRHATANCPAVTTGPADCQGTIGKAGDRETSPATIHLMTSGHAYYCASHEGCIPVEDVSMNQCVLTYIGRQEGEAPEYIGHLVVDARPVKKPN